MWRGGSGSKNIRYTFTLLFFTIPRLIIQEPQINTSNKGWEKARLIIQEPQINTSNKGWEKVERSFNFIV
jgi:hypothetical protein